MPRKETSASGDIIYYIDEEKKVVVAKYYAKPIFNKLLNSLKDIFESVQITEYFENHFIDVVDVFTGKAKCSPEDNFDVETGKKIARNRAFINYYKSCMLVVLNWHTYIAIKFGDIHKLLNSFEDRTIKAYETLEKLTGSNN